MLSVRQHAYSDLRKRSGEAPHCMYPSAPTTLARGRRAATVAGAVAGGVAGHRIEQNRDSYSYDVHVRLDNGRNVVLEQRSIDALRVGSHVRVVNGHAQLR